MTTASENYERTRAAYWDALAAHRDSAIAEIKRLTPAGVAAVVLELNDADPPRLTITAYRDSNGDDWAPEGFEDGFPFESNEDAYDVVDQIAADMDVSDWHDAQSILFRDPQNNERFIITNEEVASL